MVWFCVWVFHSYAGLLSVTFGVGGLVANVLVLSSRRVKHRGGWRIVAVLAALHAGWMLVAVALVGFEFNHDDRFYFGSRYGQFNLRAPPPRTQIVRPADTATAVDCRR